MERVFSFGAGPVTTFFLIVGFLFIGSFFVSQSFGLGILSDHSITTAATTMVLGVSSSYYFNFVSGNKALDSNIYVSLMIILIMLPFFLNISYTFGNAWINIIFRPNNGVSIGHIIYALFSGFFYFLFIYRIVTGKSYKLHSNVSSLKIGVSSVLYLPLGLDLDSLILLSNVGDMGETTSGSNPSTSSNTDSTSNNNSNKDSASAPSGWIPKEHQYTDDRRSDLTSNVAFGATRGLEFGRQVGDAAAGSVGAVVGGVAGAVIGSGIQVVVTAFEHRDEILNDQDGSRSPEAATMGESSYGIGRGESYSSIEREV
jgi:outer membrane lipoprotein SlyB